MGIIAKVGAAIQRLLVNIAVVTGAKSQVIKRRRKFTAESLAQTFVLGFLKNPAASDEDLAQMAVQCGAEVTPQAIDRRHTPAMVNFLEETFREGVKIVVGADKSLAAILERFTNVTVLDGSTITLPDSMAEKFAGCGGSYDASKAAMKLQVEMDLRGGAISHVEIEAGRSSDGATCRQHVRRGAGSLRITDLGYFNLLVFATMMAADEHFLTRLQFGTTVMLQNGEAVDLLPWLAKQRGPFVDQPVLLGKEQRLKCRLIAWRLPQEQADRRRQKLRQETKSKNGGTPSADRLAWCDWTIMVTSVPVAMLTPKEATVLYRARWQIELLFKRWKSQDLVAVLSGSTDVRQMVRVWSRLLAALVQHWLVIGSIWGDPTKSLGKACEAVRDFVGRIVAALGCLAELEGVLTALCKVFAKTCRRNKRAKAGTFEMLNDIDLLDFSLS